MRLESAGIVPDFDLPGALAPWRRWPGASPMLPSDWSWCGSRSANFVWVDPDRSRVLTEGMRTTADQLRVACSRVVTLLADIGLEAPVFLRPVAEGLVEVADETDRRVALLEAVDRELAGRFRALAAELGFPGALAPPAAFDPADPVVSSLMGLPPGPDVGPGRQPAQAKEADPVSTSTGNFLSEAIDLSQPARGVPVVFARTYNSLRAATDGPLGFGWSHGWGARLVFTDAGVVVVAGDGHEDLHRAEAGDFVAPAGVHDRLQATGAGFELTTREGLWQRFDRDGRLVAIGDRSGNALTLEYTNGTLTGVVDRSGTVTVLEHDDAGRVLAVEGILGRRWTHAYGDAGDLVGVTDPEGACTNYAYDRGHRLVSITDPEGGCVVSNGYDREGRVVTQDDGAGGRWTYRYEPGRTLVTDPLGRSRLFAFDERRRTTSLVDAAGGATRFAWDDASNLVGVTDATGRASGFGWDSAGDLVSAAGPGTAPVNLEWQEGNVVAVATGDSRWVFSWDAAAHPTGIVSAAGITTTFTWSAEGMPETTVAGDGGVTRYGYDERGHLASVTDPLGAVARVECDAAGRPAAEVHPGGGRTIFGWDGRDRLTSVTDAAGGVTSYRYDRCGRLVAFEDPVGRVTRYRYEGRGLLAAVVDPAERETTFTYDACGRLSSRTDPRGVALTQTYDPAGRLTRLAGSGLDPVAYRWDAGGRLVGMTDGTGETIWELDAAGRPVRERRPHGVELVHRYDALGRRDRIELRRGEAVVGIWEYRFDADGRIVGVAGPNGGRTALGYDAVGRLTSVSHPNGTASTTTMDLAGQPIGLVTTGPDRRTIAAWENTYDDDGNLLCRQAGGDSPGHAETTVFAYDQLGRLASASRGGSGSCTYQWDSASNCIAMRDGTEPSFAVTVGDVDQVAAAGTARFEYDPAGNLTARTGGDQPVLTISYDPLGRVTRISSDDEDVTFTYDGLGRRVLRSDGQSSVIRVHDSATVIAELAADGADGAVLYSSAGLL